MKALCVAEIVQSLELLEKGSSQQIQRAMGVLNMAMQHKATASKWDQLLQDEQSARAKLDDANQKQLELIRSPELARLKRKHDHLKESIEAMKSDLREMSEALRQQRKDNEKLVQELQKDQAQALQTAQRKWEAQKDQAIRRAEETVRSLSETVKNGGFRTTRRRTGGFWFWAWAESQDYYSKHDEAQESLKIAQAHHQKVIDLYSDKNKPQLGEDLGKRAEKTFEVQTKEINDATAKLESLRVELEDCGSKLDAHKALENQQAEEIVVLTEEWKEKKKKLVVAMSAEDLGAGYSHSIINSYKAGLDMQQAMALVGFLQKKALFNLSDFGTLWEQQCDMITLGDDADEQLAIIENVEEDLILVPEPGSDNQLTTDASVAIVFMRHVAPRYMPLPSFDDIRKGSVLEGQEQVMAIHDAAAAADKAADAADEAPLLVD